jgi:hypothetical protein
VSGNFLPLKGSLRSSPASKGYFLKIVRSQKKLYLNEVVSKLTGHPVSRLYLLAECYATLRVFTGKNSKKNSPKQFLKKIPKKFPKKNSKKKFQKKIPKIKKMFCINSYACHRGSACENLGGLGLLV